jgi:DNA primase
VKYIAIAPDGKEVEELAPKEILMQLRKKITVGEYLGKDRYNRRTESEEPVEKTTDEKFELTPADKDKLKIIARANERSEKAILLDKNLEEMKNISVKTLAGSLSRLRDKPTIIVIDGTATNSIIASAEESGCQIIVAKNFATTDTKIKLLSL